MPRKRNRPLSRSAVVRLPAVSTISRREPSKAVKAAVELPLAERLGKSILEDGARLEASRTDVDGLQAAVAGVGGGDALSRP